MTVRLLSNLENDFWDYDNIFELLDQFEFKIMIYRSLKI